VDEAARGEGADVIQKGDNGGPPSKNGTRPEKGSRQIELVITDRIDALERALGTVRRRGMAFRVHSLVRRGGELVLVFHVDASATVPDRWLAELSSLVDVHKVSVAEVK
jgi:acetolactate synthase regulatory subunit